MNTFESAIVVGMGGNQPLRDADTVNVMHQAMQVVAAGALQIRAVSRFYSTPCFPPGAGPDYVNAAILIETLLGPAALLQVLHAVEHRFGRERAQRWGMRTLDLDILTFGQTILPDRVGQSAWMNLPPEQQPGATPDHLILPHPRLQDRAFALVPLADVAPEWSHPVLGQTARQLCAALPQAEIDSVRPL